MEQAENVFLIEGIISKETKKEFKTFIRSLPALTEMIYIRINSQGGDRYAALVLIKLILFIEREKNVTVVTQCTVAGSAAMKIFAFGTRGYRQVTALSFGYIHLPEVKDGIENKDFVKKLVQQKAINEFIDISDGKLNESIIREIDLIPLTVSQMIYYGLGDSIVETFKPVCAQF